ncbi:MAG: AraC family transcriptional regulator [Flavobacteriales bacterium]|nr:AraC family transcriptional regulator [Flavobacteriales bacterium]
MIKSIVEEYQVFSLLKRQKITSLIDIVYIELSRLCVDEDVSDNKKTNNYALKFRALEEIIEAKFQEEKSPQFYASELNVSPKHLNRITKEMVGKTTTDLITERVILEAKRMLIHAQQSFTEIADELGYEDYSYFSRIFKNKTGENPSVFQTRYIK